jgi:hypothetical protein
MAAKKTLNEMENQVTKGAKPAEPQPKTPNYVPDNAPIEDLGGPTPTNGKPTDDSHKLKTPSATFAQQGDVQTKGSAGTVQLPGPSALKSTGYGKGANEEVEAESEEVVSEEPANDETVVSEEEKVEELTIDVADDVAALVEGEDLSDEYKEKTATIFEAAVKSKIEELKSNLEAQYEEQLAEEYAGLRAELTERVDSYLEYVANEWINENALQVETGIREELSESFMSGLKSLFEEHYVEIPEEKYDVLEAMTSKLDEMETKLNEQIDSNVALTKRLSASVSDNILDEVSEGLALSQKDKLSELSKGVEFESEEQYRDKLTTLKESYFKAKPVVESQEVSTEDAIAEDVSPAMEQYLQAVTKFQ